MKCSIKKSKNEIFTIQGIIKEEWEIMINFVTKYVVKYLC